MPNQDSPAVFWSILCFIPACFSTALIYSYATDPDPHHSIISYARHRLGAADLRHVPMNDYGQLHWRALPDQFAIFLYNSTLPPHIEFLHDVRVANWKHSVDVYRCDCARHTAFCAERGHGSMDKVHCAPNDKACDGEPLEPPILFYHQKEWSESYHDDLQQGKHPKPTTRRQRVRTMLRWLDQAAVQAADKLEARRNWIEDMRFRESPTQQYMRKMMEEQQKKQKKQKKQEKEEKERSKEGAKVEL
jgi:hypothetical protein